MLCCTKSCYEIFASWLLIFTLIGVITLGIVQIVYGTLNMNDITCDSFMDISTWLIVSGATSIGSVVFLLLVLFCRNHLDYSSNFGKFCINVWVTFDGAWLIVGSVLFWHYCKHLEPDHINTLMWCALIIGWVFCWMRHQTASLRFDLY
jgi:hypothetical protein